MVTTVDPVATVGEINASATVGGEVSDAPGGIVTVIEPIVFNPILVPGVVPKTAALTLHTPAAASDGTVQVVVHSSSLVLIVLRTAYFSHQFAVVAPWLTLK